MFLNTIYSDRIKAGCKLKCFPLLQRLYIRNGPHDGIQSMKYALHVLICFYGRHNEFRHGTSHGNGQLLDFHLTLFYQCAAEITQEPGLHVKVINILRRVMSVLKHVHRQHYTACVFPGQWQYIFSRRLAVAMALHPQLRRWSWIAQFDGGIKSLGLRSVLASDVNLDNIGKFPVVLGAWEECFMSEPIEDGQLWCTSWVE